MWDQINLKDYLNDAIAKEGKHLAISLSNLSKYNKEYLKITIPQISTELKENIYLYYYDMNSIPKCVCGRDKKYRGFILGYDELCCKKDCIIWKDKKQKAANKTFNENYGCHPMKTEETKNNLQSSVMSKYGVNNITTYRVNQGTYVSAFANPETHKKIKDTYNEKYGGHPMQTIEVMERQKLSSKLFYDYILPSGKAIRLQGYEGKALDNLLMNFKEDDIITSVKDINRQIGYIEYFYNGIKRKYYPDFFVISENKVYEVKSAWTYNVNKEQNELKKQACLDKGLSFEFIIY
jgi:hypothetical protein